MTDLPNHYRRLLGFDGQPRLQPDRFRKRLLDIQFNGALPAGVTVPAGSQDHTGLASSAGSLRLTTGTAAEDKAWWRGTTTYSIGAWDLLWFEAHAVRLDGSDKPLVFFCRFAQADGTGTVFGLNQNQTDPTLQLIRTSSDPESTNVPFRAGAGLAGKHHRFGVGIDPANKVGLWRVGNGPLRVTSVPNMPGSLSGVCPQIGITNKDAGIAHSIEMTAATLDGHYI